MTADVRVHVLGPLEISGIPTPRPRQQRLVIAALAAASPRPVTADRLIDGLWPSKAPKDPAKALQVVVARLRKQLAPSGIGIGFDRDGYRILLDEHEIDVRRFAALCAEEHNLPDSNGEARLSLLEQALGLFRAEPFADLPDEPLLDGPRNDLVLKRADLIARVHQLRLDLGHLDGLLPELASWATDRPLDEGAWCRWALGLHRSGRPTEALQTLHAHRLTVREHAGVEPTSALVELEARLLADDTKQVPVREQAGNLHAPRQSFVGRRRAVRELTELAQPGRILTLVGPGGVGKTTLALHLANGIAGRYRDGVWFCEFAEIENEEAVVEAMTTTLGIRQQRGENLLDSLIGGFRQAEALIVADNCEHLRSPIAELLSALADECANLVVVATSREPLALRNERVYEVKPLPVSKANRDGTGNGPAVELFIERARESGAGLTVDHETRLAIADICERLDGLPLAIELAAGRTRSMSVTEMSVRLDERFRILGRNRHDGPDRQRTLWDAVDWSYRLLDPATQDLFCRLSVFLGGFTIAAAEALVDDPALDVEQAIWSLVERSMLVRMPSRGDTTRYQMLESLRQFGHEVLYQGGRDTEIRDAHLRYFGRLAVEADHGMRIENEGSFVRRVTDELANLRSAHRHAIAGEHIDLAAGLVTSLHDYAIWRQFFELGSWAEATLEFLDEPSRHHPILLATAGWGRCIAGDFDAAVEYAQRGLELEAEVGSECGWLHDILAHCAFFQGDQERGLDQGEHEIARARAAGDLYRLSYVLADNGTHASLVPGPDTGLAKAQEALELARRTGSPAVISMAQLAMGFVHRTEAPHEAISWLRQAAELADTVDSGWTAGICRSELALLLSLYGDPREAVLLIIDQLMIFRRAGDFGRVRSSVRMAIPALRRLLDQDRMIDLIVLDSGTVDRAQILEPFNERAVGQVIEEITTELEADLIAEAAARGRASADEAVFELALELLSDVRGSPPANAG